MKRHLDAFGNVSSVTENDGTGEQTTNYSYDVVNQLRTVTDAKSFVTTIGYNLLGRKTSIVDPDVGTIGYTYDANGNRLSEIPFYVPETDWTYDALGRPLTRSGSGGNVTWSYDTAPLGKGLLATRADGAGTFTALAYDLRGRATSDRQTISGSGLDFTTAYDPLDQVTSRSYPTSGAATVLYQHDPAGYLTSINRVGGTTYANNVQWDASGRLTSWTAGNGVVTTSNYADTTGRLDTVSVKLGAAKLEQLQFGYYGNDLIQTITDQSDVPYPNQSFSYDGLNRLVAATGPYGTNFASTTLRYAYDAIGNLTCKDASAVSPSCTPGTLGTAMTYPTAQSYANHPVHAPATVNGALVSYDSLGNLLGYGSRAYTYDGLSQLQTVSNAGVLQATYAYDATGSRASAVDNTTPRAVTRYFVRNDYEWEATRQFAKIHVLLGGQPVATETELLPQAPAAVAPGAPLDRPLVLGIAITPAVLASLLIGIQLLRLRRRRAPLGEPAVAGFAVIALAVGFAAPVWALPPLPLDATGKPIPNGDLNADGKIDAADVYLAEQIATGRRAPSNDEVDRGDVAPLDQAPKSPHAVKAGDVVLLLRALREGDVDGDGIPNSQELALQSSPFRLDSDRDGASDATEVGTFGSNPSRPDTDGDGVLDGDEVTQGSDPMDTDTDGDGYPDGQDGAKRKGIVYRHQDHLGSTAVVTRSDGQVIQRVVYKPYGAMQSASGSDYSKRLGFYFTGQRYEAAVGIYDYGARFYDPTIGRFLQADTVVPDPKNPQTFNRYAYVQNNPISRVDPSGRVSLDLGVGFGTLSYSSDIGFGFDWGPSLGASFSTGSYGNGWGFSAMAGWDKGSGGFSADFSGWFGSNYFGAGYGYGQAYVATQFGSYGGALVIGQRALQAEAALDQHLGLVNPTVASGLSSRLVVNPRLGSNDEHASYNGKLGGDIGLNESSYSRLGFGKLRAALGHEIFHLVDDTIADQLDEVLYGMDDELGGPHFKVWNSKFTSSEDLDFHRMALELRATVFESSTNKYRGLAPDLETQHYLNQYGKPLEALGVRERVLDAP